MKIPRLSYLLYPELSLLSTDEDREAILLELSSAFFQSHWRNARLWLSYVLIFIVILGVAAISRYLGRRMSISHNLQMMIIALPGLLIAFSVGIIVTFVWRKSMQRILRQLLLARGIPLCVTCGYSLEGNISGRCPECGAAATHPKVRSTSNV